jgi:hypothetical protein
MPSELPVSPFSTGCEVPEAGREERAEKRLFLFLLIGFGNWPVHERDRTVPIPVAYLSSTTTCGTPGYGDRASWPAIF